MVKKRSQKGGGTPLRVTPLGGCGEIGRNMMTIEDDHTMIIIDAGVMFPEHDMLGIDLVIPDFSYIREHNSKIQAVFITHGHEDHIGALPFLLREVQVPIYATKLAASLIMHKLEEHKMQDLAKIQIVSDGDRVQVGDFEVEFIAANHSIPDDVAMAIRTPLGTIVHSSDFKFDYTPVGKQGSHLSRLAQIGAEDVLLLMADSTGAARPGSTPSESIVENAFENIFRSAPGRVIITTFASLLARIQQIINVAAELHRVVTVTGYSMKQYVRIAQELDYLDIPAGVLVDVKEIGRYPDKQVIIITTGSQGQPEAALARMADGRHRDIQIKPNDTVVFSATPIPGNEEDVSRVINKLIKLRAEVIYPPLAPVHVSGHASQEEIKLLLTLVRPRNYLPIHGELRHLHANANIAKELGLSPEHIFEIENGDTLVIQRNGKMAIQRQATNGEYIFVDGSGVGDIGPAVIHDREILSRDGFVIIGVQWDQAAGAIIPPIDLVSRGFVYLRESAPLMQDARKQLAATLEKFGPGTSKRKLSEALRKDLQRYLYKETHRRPMIIPMITYI